MLIVTDRSLHPPDSQLGVSEIEQLILDLADRGLTRYFEDAEFADALVGWLHSETGRPKALLRLGVKLLGQAVSAVSRKSVAWIATRSGRKVVAGVAEIGPLRDLVSWVRQFVARFDEELRAKQEFRSFLTGAAAPGPELIKSLTLDLQAHVRELEGIESLQSQIADLRAQLSDRLTPQPALYLRLVPNTYENRFLYAARAQEFVGREAALSTLSEFLYSEGAFSWYGVAGQGGSGKSRLVLEVCLRNGGAWRSGFLRTPKDFSAWDAWQPDQPTLLVMDYAEREAESIGALVRRLHERADLLFPVRLLVVTRDEEGTWRERFFGTGTDRAVTRAGSFGPTLVLGPLDEQDLWRIVEAQLGAADLAESKQQILLQLRRIDPYGRPLFATLAADALGAGRNLRHWDRQALVQDVLARERSEHWVPAGAGDKDLNLLALSTLVGELPTRRLPELDPQHFPSAAEFSPDRYRIMSGLPAEEVLHELGPDILGELFVLEHLRPRHAADVSRAEGIQRVAWQLGGFGLASFLPRAAMDFPGHPTLDFLERPANHNIFTRMAWALCVPFLTDVYSGTDLERSLKLYSELAILAAQHPSEPILRQAQANAAFNLITDLAVADNIPEALKLHNDLSSLMEHHDWEPGVVYGYALSTSNLIFAYRKRQDLQTVLALRAKLVERLSLISHYPLSREILTRSAFNTLLLYCEAGEVEKAQGCYSDLLAHGGDGPLSLDTVELQAVGGLEMIRALGRVDAIPAIREVFECLVNLDQRGPISASSLDTIAEQGALLILAYCSRGDLSSAEAVFEEIVALAVRHPHADRIRTQQARGAAKLLAFYSKTIRHERWSAILGLPRFVKSQAVYRSIYAVGDVGHESPAFVDQVCKVAVNMMCVCEAACQLEESEVIYNELHRLILRTSGASTDRRALAQAGGGLVGLSALSGDLVRAWRVYRELAMLTASHPQEAGIRESLGRAAFSLCALGLRAGNVPSAQAAYHSLANLACAHPTDPVLQDVYARAEKLLGENGPRQ